jgi:hypothetical protein
MEQSNNLDTVKLKKVVEDIFTGGGNAAERFDCSLYTDKELEYIITEIEEQCKKEVADLVKLADECDKEENEVPKKTN